VRIRVISWLMSFLWSVVRGGLPLSPSLPLLVCLFLSCAQPTDSTDDGAVERERVEVSGSISEDAVWESGKEYVVTGDVIVEAGATLTIQPEVVVKFSHERADDYYGITVEGTLIADGGDSTTAILFTSGASEWAKKPGDWRGIEVDASSGTVSWWILRGIRCD